MTEHAAMKGGRTRRHSGSLRNLWLIRICGLFALSCDGSMRTEALYVESKEDRDISSVLDGERWKFETEWERGVCIKLKFRL